MENDCSLDEQALIENVINKLQIYMTRNKMNLHTFTKSIGFQYQPFYRIITQKKLPGIPSLLLIANHLGYKFDDLISDKIYETFSIIDNLKNIDLIDHLKKHQIKLPFHVFSKFDESRFFGISSLDVSRLENDFSSIEIYATIKQINSDGRFIIKHDNVITEVIVSNINSKFITISQNKQEKQINYNQFESIAQFIGTVVFNKNISVFFNGNIIK